MEALEDLRDVLDTARQNLDAYTDRPNSISEWFDGARARRADWPSEVLAAQQIPLTRSTLVELGEAGGWLEAVESEVALARRPRVKSTP
jgi:prephenate dehydrogenase